MNNNIEVLTYYCQQMLLPDREKVQVAEEFLKKISTQPGFSPLIFEYLGLTNIELPFKQAAAIFFKNFVKKNWPEDESSGTGTGISEEDRSHIKHNIISLMLGAPKLIQKQLSSTLQIICSHDFPAKWPYLLQELVQRLQTKDWSIVFGVLGTAHAIFKSLRFQFKTDAVMAEFKYVLDHFQAPLLGIFQMVNQSIQHLTSGSCENEIILLFKVLKLAVRIFYSLNFLDLPEFFEDNMKEWMEGFLKYLSVEHPFPPCVIQADDTEKPGLLHIVQASICDNINLYAEKYEEEFAHYLPFFVDGVWRLIVSLKPIPKFDILVTSVVRFLTSVAVSVHYKLFNDQEALKGICQNIVIPNMKFRESDEELFEDNPIEYIRQDIEGSDGDTRRRASIELIRGLRRHFEAQITGICSQDVNNLLAQYASNPTGAWKAKDTAIFLVAALAVKASTQALGTTETNTLVPLRDFYISQILPELANPQAHPVIKADALKFLTIFRQPLHFSKEEFIQIFNHLLIALESDNFVVKTYAGVAIERLLMLKDNNQNRITKDDIAPLFPHLLTKFFKALESSTGTEKNLIENEYLMRSILRILVVGKNLVVPVHSEVLQHLSKYLTMVSENPRNPSFNHSLFEAIAVLTRNTIDDNPNLLPEFEVALLQIFENILTKDIAEFTPYVFQILSLLLEYSKTRPSDLFFHIFPHFLVPVLWEKDGNIPPLTRLLQAYLSKLGSLIVEHEHLSHVLGVFQKLIAAPSTDHQAFFLLESIVQYIEPIHLEKCMPTVFNLIFTRLTHRKTLKFQKSFIVFLSMFITKHGGPFVLGLIEAVQANLVVKILENIWIPNIQKVAGKIERKTCGVAMTKLLCETPQMLSNSDLFSLWPLLFKTTFHLFINSQEEDEAKPAPSIPQTPTTLLGDEELDSTTNPLYYMAAFSELTYAKQINIDTLSDIDPKKFFCVSLQQLSQNHPGKFQAIMNSTLTEKENISFKQLFLFYNLPQLY